MRWIIEKLSGVGDAGIIWPIGAKCMVNAVIAEMDFGAMNYRVRDSSDYPPVRRRLLLSLIWRTAIPTITIRNA
jgi:hypothetical protein